jgi:SPP1 gp7 family putative phage head morphogenesis protein
MLSGVDLSKLSLSQLEGVSEAVEIFLCKQRPPGEPWNPGYKKNRKLFKKLVRLTVKMKRNLDKFFLTQRERLSYQMRLPLVQADEASDFVKQLDWDEEERKLTAVLEIDLGEIFAVGALATEMELQANLNIGPTNTEEAKFLRKYVVELAGEITDTTKKRITEQIRTSLEVGETKQQLASRINKILNNPKRSRAIAQTESIRAYAEGRVAVGRKLGIKYKQWQAFVGSACPICSKAHGQIVGLEERFNVGSFSPPGHVNCRCHLKLLYTNPNKEEEETDAPEIDLKALFDSAR